MAGMIPQQFIDDLLSRADIVEVINQRVPLKKAGKEYQACCPFHGEKTPSFTVSPSKQFYHCFGCGVHGSAISFLMEYDRLSFPDAVEELASSMGIDVPREIGFDKGPDNRGIYDLLEKSSTFYQQQLRQHPQAHLGSDYLKGRGLSGEVANLFKLGFAPPGWDNLIKHIGSDHKSLDQLDKAGLITRNEGKTYDRLRERVIFPILDARGRTIGFGGRILGDGKPKYLNSPETPVFHKGRELYGLYQAKQANRQLERILVVEGYMDVVALAQFDISNAVATLGTATTPEHIEKLYRSSHEIVFCFDGDRAGNDAAWKALNTALPAMKEGRQARFLFLPDGEDPDSLVRQIGKVEFEKLVTHSTPLSEFLFNKLSSQVDTDSIDGRARLAALATPLLKQLPNGTFRDMMEHALSKRIGMDAPVPSSQPEAKPTPARLQKWEQMPLVRRAVALLLQHPEVAQDANIPNIWQDSTLPGIDLLKELLELCRNNPQLHTAALVEHWQDAKMRQHLNALAIGHLLVRNDAHEKFIGTLDNIGEQVTKEQRTQIHQKLKPSDMSEEEKQELRELYKRKTDEKPTSL